MVSHNSYPNLRTRFNDLSNWVATTILTNAGTHKDKAGVIVHWLKVMEASWSRPRKLLQFTGGRKIKQLRRHDASLSRTTAAAYKKLKRCLEGRTQEIPEQFPDGEPNESKLNFSDYFRRLTSSRKPKISSITEIAWENSTNSNLIYQYTQ